jgi:hypothetical protein
MEKLEPLAKLNSLSNSPELFCLEYTPDFRRSWFDVWYSFPLIIVENRLVIFGTFPIEIFSLLSIILLVEVSTISISPFIEFTQDLRFNLVSR